MSNLYFSRLILSVAGACVLALGCASSEVPSTEPPTSAAPSPEPGDQGTPEAPASGDTVLEDDGSEAGQGSCAGLAAAACGATEGCQVVRGARIVAKAAAAEAAGAEAAGAEAAAAASAHCLQPMTEIACIPAQMCAQVISYFCNDAGDVYQVTNACGPTSWKPCQEPQQLQGACTP